MNLQIFLLEYRRVRGVECIIALNDLRYLISGSVGARSPGLLLYQ